MVAKAEQYFLKSQENPIYVSVTDKGAEFPNEEPYQHVVHFEADPLNK
jgi:hypothetical protein